MALAPLGFTVDTSGVARAVADLGNMTAATGKAEAAAKSLSVNVNLAVNVVNNITAATRNAAAANDNLTTAINKQAAAIANLTAAEARNTAGHYAARAADVAEYGAELDRLRAKFNPVFAASKAYETELNELNRAHKVGAINAAEHGAALLALNGRYQAAAAGANTFSLSAGMARMQTANLGYQIQDIATMLAMGQNPFLLLAQQLPQVTMYGGKLTGVMGALKGTIAGLFSPLGLLTTAFVLGGSAAVSFFDDAADSGEKAADELEKQQDLVRRVADEWGDAVPEIAAYADELDRLAKLRELREGTDSGLDAAYAKAREEVKGINDELISLITYLEEMDAPATEVADLQDAFAALNVAIQEQKGGAEELDNVQRLLANLFSNISSPATAGLAEDFAYLAQELRNASRDAAGLRDTLSTLESRDGIGLSGFGGGRGSDPRDVLGEDDGGYWRNRFFPDPEDPAKKPRAARKPRKSDEEREAERAKQAYDDLVRSSEQFIDMQGVEQQALFMSTEAAQALRYEQEMLARAADANIKLTPEMTAELKAYAVEMAAAEEATRQLQEAMDFARDVVGGFLSDFMSGIEQGKSVWESFGNAGLNALQRIADKLIEMATDELISGLFKNVLGGMFGGGAGFFPAAPSIGFHTLHNGGIAGRDSSGVRLASPSIFANAPRYHGGGIAGLLPDEIPAILQKGERVIPRNAANQNGGGTVVQIIDQRKGGTVSQERSRGPSGEEVVRVMIRDEIESFSRFGMPDRVNQIVEDRRAVG